WCIGKKAIYLGVPFIAEWFRNKGHFIKSQVTATGALALIQLQEDMKKKPSVERKYTEEKLEEYMNSHKKWMIDSLWKLNMADIKAILSRMSQMVLQDPTMKKEELRARAKGLRTLGWIFHKAKSASETESEPILPFGVHNLNGVDQDHSSRGVEPKQSSQTTMAPQSHYTNRSSVGHDVSHELLATSNC
ncbi:chaperone protein DnaJ 10-like protein, partial [Tanacetum coccineum]